MDRETFDRWAREHTAALYRLASRLVRSRTDAEDLLQETFLRAWRGLGKFRGESELRTWLYRILLNTAHGFRRRRPEVFLDEETRGKTRDPGARIERRETLDRVLGAVRALPRRQREALLLRATGGLGYDEIAKVMRIKRTAVKSHLAHARRKLLRRFDEDLGGMGIRDTGNRAMGAGGAVR